MKKVLLISQVLPPWYLDVIRRSLKSDTQIDVITGTEGLTGEIIPSPQHDPKNIKTRLVCWGKHYMFLKKWVKNNKNESYDLIMAVSNPPINSMIGVKLKKIFNAPFVYMNWDLYPQVIEYSMKGYIPMLLSFFWKKMNNYYYPKIDKMLTIGEAVAQSLKYELQTNIPVEIFPLSTDVERFFPISKERNPFIQKHNLQEKFIVLYSGKMGYGHNIEIILETASKLQKIEDIQFVFIGHGPKFQIVQKFMETTGVSNIVLLPYQPEDIVPYSLACADIALVSQELNMAKLCMPSKTYNSMAVGSAIIGICSGDDDLSALIKTHKIGAVVSEGDSDELAKRILQLHNDEALLKKYKANARSVAESEYSIEVSIKRYRSLFSEMGV